MNKTDTLSSLVEEPDPEDTLKLNECINNILKPYGGRTRTLCLFVLATKYYTELKNETEFDLIDYQIAAERIVRDTGQSENRNALQRDQSDGDV